MLLVQHIAKGRCPSVLFNWSPAVFLERKSGTYFLLLALEASSCVSSELTSGSSLVMLVTNLTKKPKNFTNNLCLNPYLSPKHTLHVYDTFKLRRFIPVFLASSKVFLCGGSWMYLSTSARPTNSSGRSHMECRVVGL